MLRPGIRRLLLPVSGLCVSALAAGWFLQPARSLAGRLQDAIESRAAVELEDDFRSGLSRWVDEGGMKGWEYDPAGFLRPGRRLALFRDSLHLTDYRLEFLAQVEQKGLQWVFRATGPGNHYGSGIVILKPGPLPVAAILRSVVIDGKEVARARLPLPQTIRPDTMYRVSVHVRGSQFTTFVNGQLVDTWSDTRLPSGGVGFLCENDGRARLRWVRVVDRDDWLGRLCSYVSGWK